MRRSLTVGLMTGALLVGTVGVASAQEEPEPPDVNCYPLSGLVCQVPVNVGPFGPFTFDIALPNGIFGPPQP